MTPQQLAYRAAHYTPWYERIGDGGTIGWITAAGYLAVGLLCLRAAQRFSTADKRLWLAAAAVLIALGINKQLDLQVALVEFWRDHALANGWYGARRTIQRVAFAIAIVAGTAIVLWLLPVVRRRGAEMRAAFAGMAFIAVYVVLRAAKFQHIFSPGPVKPTGPGWLSLLELGGLAVVACAAWFYIRRNSRPS